MTKQLVVGVDIDGVLASFNRGFSQILFEQTGQRFLPNDEEPSCWAWPTAYGYTKDQESAAWAEVKRRVDFWATLKPMFGAQATIAELNLIMAAGHEVYYMTTRMGQSPWQQSLYWLQQQGALSPQVLICRSDKGGAAKTLGLSHFIDDKSANCESVKEANPECRVFLLSRRWNEYWHEEAPKRLIEVTPSTLHFLEEVGRDAKS